jgi:hypothetical protein
LNAPHSTATPSAIEVAMRAGIDIGLLEDNLRMSHEQRVLQHQDALDLALHLERAGRILHERSATPAATPG